MIQFLVRGAVRRMIQTLAVAVLVATGGCADEPNAGSPDKSSASPRSTAEPSMRVADPIVAAIPVGTGPSGLLEAGGAIWVENHRDNNVTRIDPATNTVRHLPDVPVHCQLAADGDTIWATNYQSNRVTQFEQSTGEIVQQFQVAGVCGLDVDDTGIWLFGSTGDLSHRNRDGTLISKIELARPFTPAVAVAKHGVWALNEDGLVHLNAAGTKIKTAIPVADVDDLRATDSAVWLSSRAAMKVVKVDPATEKIVATIPFDSQIGGIGASDDDVWVTGWDSGMLWRIDAKSSEVVAQANLRENQPADVSVGLTHLQPPIFAFGTVWIGALDGNFVIRVDPKKLT